MADPKQPPGRNIIDRFAFRWSIVTLPLAVVIAIWLVTAVQVSVCWDDLLREMGIVDCMRYSAACTLAAMAAALIAAVRICHQE